MRWIVLVLGVLGGLLAAALGITWISDYNRLQATVRELSSAGADLSALSGLVRAAYVLLVGAVLGLAGGLALLVRPPVQPAA